MVDDDALERVAALAVLEKQQSEELPAIATDALVRGLDSPSLRLLAGTSPRDVRDARDLLWSALDELGIAKPSQTEARWLLVRGWAHDIIANRLAPIDGARRIWWDGWEELGRPDDLTAFVGLASDWEDDESRRYQYDQDIREAAARLVDNRP